MDSEACNKANRDGTQSANGPSRLHTLLKAASFGTLLITASCAAYHVPQPKSDYSRLVELIKLEDRVEPLYAFNDFEEGFDKDSHRANLEYLEDHPGLIKKIQADLGGGALRWSLDGLSSRLLFVPEEREEYAALYERYCNDVIDYILDETGFANPYESIQTLLEEGPEIPDSSEGVTAYLVHNLSKEFVASYTFTNRRRKRVLIELSGNLLLGEVGSYTTDISLADDGTLEYTRDRYTIWQNSAKNPYTVLMVPAEETLHILLREHTERGIKKEIEMDDIRGNRKVEWIAEQWAAVEEGIVGGVVYALLPRFLGKHVDNLPDSLVEGDLESKAEFKKYRYLRRGINVVETLGHHDALEMYMDDPMMFKGLLISVQE